MNFTNARMRFLKRIRQSKLVRFILLTVIVVATQKLSVIAQNQPELSFSHYGELTTFKLNVRKDPSLNAEILDTLSIHEQINYSEYNDKWVVIKYGNEVAYLYKEYVEELVVKSSKGVWNDQRKSYMDYRKITSKNSKQYQLQANYAHTSPDGYRMVGERYCIALGSYYTKSVGCYVDVVLENGIVIPCILGDCKANCDTLDNNSRGKDGGVAEFIVDEKQLPPQVKKAGDCSNFYDWDSPVVEIRIYNKSIL